MTGSAETVPAEGEIYLAPIGQHLVIQRSRPMKRTAKAGQMGERPLPLATQPPGVPLIKGGNLSRQARHCWIVGWRAYGVFN